MKKYYEIIPFIRRTFGIEEGLIPLHAPVFVGNEKKYLNECIDSTYVSSVGKFVDLFEEKIAEYAGAKRAVVCVNGTNALHLALMMVNVGRETEVITQPLTFIATANAICYCGAIPVFLDVDLDTLGLSARALSNWLKKNVELKKVKPRQVSLSDHQDDLYPFNKKTGRRISAVVPMHTFGHPCRIDDIVTICDRYNIPVVEDAAESLGSFYLGRHTGTLGKIGVLSFNGNKIITTGGGGMLLFMDKDLGDKAKHLTTQAKVPHRWEFGHDDIGYNYRMPNINAALGLAQLEVLGKYLKAKRQLASTYKQYFKDHDITFIEEPNQARSNYWLNAILLQNRFDRDEFLAITNDHGIQTRPAWKLMNELIMFRKCQTDTLENSRFIVERLVNLPSSVILPR